MDTLNIKEEFSEYPGLRYCTFSDQSGEEFYHKILNSRFKKALDNKENLQIILDGTAGYSPSFLDESFGNLIYDFTLEKVKKIISIVSEEEPYLIDFLKDSTFQEWEERRTKNEKVKVTVPHEAWWRYVNKEYVQKVWANPLADKKQD